jgi:drug/metabolite transporter (DMT)-like permease
MNKIIRYLALKSYLIVKYVFVLFFILLIIFHSILSSEVPYWLIITFILVSGIYIGYSIAYFSIKQIQSEK